MKYSLLLAALLPMTATAQAPANSDMPDMGQVFLEQFDTDKDGKVTLAEAEVPKAMAEAFNSGKLGLMDYYDMKNVQADTKMRDSLSGVGAAAAPSTAS